MVPKAYLDYLVVFHGPRDYFECHEILEEHWKAEKERKRLWVGLIQVAVSLYHHRRGNFPGAQRMMLSAIAILEQEDLSPLGLDKEELLKRLRIRLHEIENQMPYTSINLPICDEKLASLCREICEKQGHVWGAPSDLNNPFLIHKHTMRDRSGIIRAREEKLKQKGNFNDGSRNNRNMPSS